MFTNDDSVHKKTAGLFQAVKFLPDILTLTLVLSSTFLSSKTSDFKLVIQKIMAPNDPTQSAVFNLLLQFPAVLLVSA